MPDSFSADVTRTVLEAGGNAVDAAVAAAFTLAVTYPEAGNIGGGGFMLLRMDGDSEFLDYREVAPAAASRDMFLDDSGEVIKGSSLTGHRAAGVPGTVAGLWAAHQRHGLLPWAQLLAEPIRLARDGFTVDRELAGRYRHALKMHGGLTNLAAHFGDMTAGSTLRQPELAATLTRIAESGAAEFYTGTTAELLVAEMARGDGLISATDLANYSAVWRPPLNMQWREFDLVTAPPPSSGGVALLQLLHMRDLLASEFAGLTHNSSAYVHLIAEMEKRVFADRAEYMGDPDFVEVPVAELLAPAYLAERAMPISPNAISPTPAVQPGLESTDTTHFSIVDRWGNAVSNTYTINFGFGNGVVVTGAGFLLNNEMDDFSVKPGVPNVYGVVGADANAIAPNKRMLSSMTPTILLRDDQVQMVVGSPGGSTIITSVFQTLLNLVDFNFTPQAAVDAPRFHHQLLPKDLISMSLALPDDTQRELSDMGYRVEHNSWGVYGDVQLIWRGPSGLGAASDRRYRGQSLVVDSYFEPAPSE